MGLKSDDKIRQYETRFPFETPEGVRILIEQSPYVGESRFTRGDLVASDILMDLTRAIELAGLTDRQRYILHRVVYLGNPQKDVAIELETTQSSISTSIRRACIKIAAIFEEWGYSDVEPTRTIYDDIRDILGVRHGGGNADGGQT